MFDFFKKDKTPKAELTDTADSEAKLEPKLKQDTLAEATLAQAALPQHLSLIHI